MPTGQQIFQLRIELDEVTPAVWRRLLVPGGVRLAKLHLILQAAMGWTNSHLHAFTIDGERYGMKFDDDFLDEDLDLLDERAVTVIRALGAQNAVAYEYDFGDGWDHTVVVEARYTLPYGLKHAVCLDGANACPPEDCGGSGSYEDLLVALADPGHEDHAELLEWIGGPFDPTAFDLVAANVALQHVH
jgi:hypothetical protein